MHAEYSLPFPFQLHSFLLLPHLWLRTQGLLTAHKDGAECKLISRLIVTMPETLGSYTVQDIIALM